MNTEFEGVESSMASQVDRLVCGELDEPARQTLLAWLEADPVRWRLCGVAFLEAQVWSRVLECGPRIDAQAATAAHASEGLLRPQSRVRRRALVRQASIAAAVVVAFGLGLAIRDFSAPRQHVAETAGGGAPSRADPTLSVSPSSIPSKQDPVLASFNVETGGDTGRMTPIQIPVVPAATEAGHDRDHSEIPEYVRQQWERRGYKVSLERRFLFAKLANGQQVVVPVEQLHVNPLPIHVN